jgi:hypothetical protein
MIEIPVNDAGRFEAVDEAGTVVGRGVIYGPDNQPVGGALTAEVVEFEHDGLPGAPAQQVHMPLVEFTTTWEALPQSRFLTLRAAG